MGLFRQIAEVNAYARAASIAARFNSSASLFRTLHLLYVEPKTRQDTKEESEHSSERATAVHVRYLDEVHCKLLNLPLSVKTGENCSDSPERLFSF